MPCNLSLSGLGSNPIHTQCSLWHTPKVIPIAHPVRGKGCLVAPLADVAMTLFTSLSYICQCNFLMSFQAELVLLVCLQENPHPKQALCVIAESWLIKDQFFLSNSSKVVAIGGNYDFSFSLGLFCCTVETLYTFELFIFYLFFFCQVNETGGNENNYKAWALLFSPISLPPIIALQLITKSALVPIIS